MKDELSQLFNERFAGHESPVDPGLWDAIQGQLGSEQLASSEEGLKDLFKERFNGHEVPVDPAVWSNISQQLGHGAAAGSAGTGVFTWVAAAIGAVVIAGATYLYFDQNEAPLHAALPTTEMPAPAPSPVVPSPSAPAMEVGTAEKPLTVAPATTIKEQTTTSPSVPVRVAEPTPQVIAPEASLSAAVPTTGAAETDGAQIVEDILTELTTRVTEEVLAEAAERNTMPATPPATTSAPAVLEPEPLPKREVPKLFLPNTFTPNDDGVNDTYTVLDSDQFERVMMRVYDVRSDRLVFSTNTNQPWTGDGCMDGYYLVAVEAVTSEGELVTQGKVVWLNRNTMH